MAFPIAFVHIATAMAGPTAVARIDEQQRYACPLGFVDQELPQLPKTPIMLLAALRFANRDPVAHVRQLFEHKRGFCVFRIRHKAFTQRVIGGSLEAGLCSRHLLQAPLGAFGVRRLVGFASRGRPRPDYFNVIARIRVAIRVRGKVHDTQVHTQKRVG